MMRKYIVIVEIILFAFFFVFLIQSVSADITFKWDYDTTQHGDPVDLHWSSSTLPVTANVDDDPQHEIFYGVGANSGGGIYDGAVICLDGLNGSLEWVYTGNGFGRHTTLELGDTDQDGRLELVAGGMKNVVCLDAETGDLEWEYWVAQPYTDDRRKDKHSIILKDTDGETYVFMSGNYNTGEPVIKFAGTDTDLYDPGDIVEQGLLSHYTCHGGFACWDIDNDGDYDLWNSDRSTGNGLYWVDTDLNMLDSWSSVWCSSHTPTIIDVNGDGYLDVVIADQAGDGICVVDGQTKGPMAGKWQEHIPGFNAHDNCNIYDVDGDGHLELISGDNSVSTPAYIFDLEDWSMDETIWMEGTSGSTGYAHPLAIGNVWGDSEFELIGFTSNKIVVYDPLDNYAIKKTITAYCNQMIVQDVDNDGLNEIITIGTKSVPAGNSWGVVQVYDTDGVNSGYRTWNQWYSERRTGAPGDLGSSLAPLAVETSNDTTVSIDPSNQTVSSGDIFTVNVSCVPGQPIRSFEFMFSFNASLFQVDSVIEGDIFDGYDTYFNAGTINNTNGTIVDIYDLITGSGNISGPGTFVTISCTAKDVSGISSLILYNVGVTDEIAYISIDVNNGSVSIEEEYTLSITTDGNGSVTKDPDQDTYVYGDVVELTASADDGWSFVSWSGDLSGSDNPDSLTITGDMSVTAHFSQNSYTLSVNVVGSGSVLKDPDQGSYVYGDVVELTAVADDGWSFVSWSGNLSGSTNPDSVTIIGDMSVTAHFMDSDSPEISNVAITTSNPLDTDSSFGWINITCSVTDNVAVNDVSLNITNPDGSYNNVSMNAIGASSYYYNSSTAFSIYGNYSYFIWADDTSDNADTSSNYDFSMPPNRDVNNDGDCNVLDYVLISNHYGEIGTAGWICEDVDNSGQVSVLDIVLVSNHCGESWWV